MRIDDEQDVYTKERKVLHFDQVGIDHLIRLGSVHNRAVRPSGEEHVHRDSFELVFFEGGQQQYQVGREIYTVHSREMFLTYPNEPHCIMDCKEEKSQFYYLILYFPRDLKRFAGLSPESTDLVRRFFYSSQRISPISRQLLTLLGSIVKLYFSSEPLRVELIRAKTVELLYELVKIPELARADPTDSDSIMEQLLDFIGQNPTRPITLEFGKFNIPGCITMSSHAKKYRKIKGIEQSEYPGISRKDTPKPALLARLLALAAGERFAFT